MSQELVRQVLDRHLEPVLGLTQPACNFIRGTTVLAFAFQLASTDTAKWPRQALCFAGSLDARCNDIGKGYPCGLQHQHIEKARSAERLANRPILRNRRPGAVENDVT